MKNSIFGIFAHPDDEAFGPAGTLLKLKEEGYDIHLILLTDGEAGMNIDNVPDLAATRYKEWQTAAKLLGAQSHHALHYPDGALDTVSSDELFAKARTIIETTLASYNEPVELSLLTFEPNGLTGHRDHIVASQLVSHLAQELSATSVWYFCLNKTQAPLESTAYYEPRARQDDYITDQIDVSAYVDTIYSLIDTHHSQRRDGANRKALGKERLSTEYFRIER